MRSFINSITNASAFGIRQDRNVVAGERTWASALVRYLHGRHVHAVVAGLPAVAAWLKPAAMAAAMSPRTTSPTMTGPQTCLPPVRLRGSLSATFSG